MRKLIIYSGMIALFLSTPLFSQLTEEEMDWRKEEETPSVIDFSKMFEKESQTRDEHSAIMDKQRQKIQDRLAKPEILEKAIDPETYIVGPGDIFTFYVWGAIEMQFPVAVSPEGNLAVPSVGNIDVDGLRLKEVQELALESASKYYENSQVSLQLTSLRFFRVHVVGEVLFPGTYTAQASDRISDMIFEAGGPTEWAFLNSVELRRRNGDKMHFDLSEFEVSGSIDNNIFLSGGDIIYVTPKQTAQPFVTIEGDFDSGGRFQISDEEMLIPFLRGKGVLKNNTDLANIVIMRKGTDGKDYLSPFKEGKAEQFTLKGGDRIVLPSQYVYVKGAVRNPGAFPYVNNLTARDYAGMAGGDYQSRGIKSLKVYHASSGKYENDPEAIIYPGDVIEMPRSWSLIFRDYATVFSGIGSLLIAGRAVGWWADN